MYYIESVDKFLHTVNHVIGEDGREGGRVGGRERGSERTLTLNTIFDTQFTHSQFLSFVKASRMALRPTTAVPPPMTEMATAITTAVATAVATATVSVAMLGWREGGTEGGLVKCASLRDLLMCDVP